MINESSLVERFFTSLQTVNMNYELILILLIFFFVKYVYLITHEYLQFVIYIKVV